MVRIWFLLIVAGLMAVCAQANVPTVDGLTISAPRNDATITGPNVVVSGYGDSGTVTVRVFRGNERVYSEQPTVKNGRWLTTPFKLNNGTYNATVEQGNTVKTVSFTVGSSKGFGFVSPGNGDRVPGPEVTFSGTADTGPIALKVYKGSDVVFQKDVDVQDGSWSTTGRFADGPYRAEVKRGEAVRSVDFRVGASLPDEVVVPSGPALAIDSPREGANVKGQSVTLGGRATESSVSIRLYDGNEVVYQGAVAVKDGHWSITRDMSLGAHTVVVQQKDMVKTTKFTVQPAGSIKPVKTIDLAAFAFPREGATVAGPRVKFSGTASTPSVGVYIYQDDKRVFEGSQKVEKGRWMFTTELKSGTYRVEITAGTGHATLNVKVK